MFIFELKKSQLRCRRFICLPQGNSGELRGSVCAIEIVCKTVIVSLERKDALSFKKDCIMPQTY